MILRASVNKMLGTLSTAGILAAAVMAVSGIAGATILATTTTGSYAGQLNLGGLSVQVLGDPTTGCINFFTTSNTPDTACNTPNTFQVIPQSDSALFVLNSNGTIKDIPAGTVNLSAFVTTTGTGGVPNTTFDLTNLVTPLIAPCAAGQNTGLCSAGPFVFNSYVSGSTYYTTVSFSANLCGYITGSTPGALCATGTPYTGAFSTQFTGTNDSISSLINQSLAPGGITNSVSATFNPAPVPEPGTTLLLGSGLLAVGMVVRRFRA